MPTRQAREALRTFFGFSDFREGQEAVIDAVLLGNDCVVVMPTGGGKSLCYQLPAMIIDGMTIVVSPLIALMKDQVDSLISRRIPATFINSSLGYRELGNRLGEIRRGAVKIVYVAPERFRNRAFTEAIKGSRIRLLAIDEAHCVSHWGHDFRPDYLMLRSAAERLGSPPIIALTATATPRVRADLVQHLGLRTPRVFVAGFDRPNLSLNVRHVSGDRDKLQILNQVIAESEGGQGIVYAATRKSVEQLSGSLKMAGIAVEPYHAGMSDAERNRAQEMLMAGELRAMIATIAFGMGIDKSDIRFVVHYHMPGSIEAYYQEIGRAGRDLLPSECVLLFNYADSRTHQFFIEGSHPSIDTIESVHRYLASRGSELVECSTAEIAEAINIKNVMSVSSALAALERAGHVRRGGARSAGVSVSLKIPLEAALGDHADESMNGLVLRELVFNHGVDDCRQSSVDPATVAAALGVREAGVRRSIAALAAAGILESRPEFDGKGIFLLDESPARELRVDRETIAARSAAEHQKLRRMIDYCYHTACLRGFLLRYFGDPKPISDCGNCSSCRSRRGRSERPGTDTDREPVEMSPVEIDRLTIERAPTGQALRARLRAARRAPVAEKDNLQDEANSGIIGGAGRELSEDEIVVVRKILSCVARLKNRFGKGMVAAVLCGSTSRQVLENHLDRLSTYGLLRSMPRERVNRYIRVLIGTGCISVSGGVYPTVGLSETGREVMMGRARIRLPLD